MRDLLYEGREALVGYSVIGSKISPPSRKVSVNGESVFLVVVESYCTTWFTTEDVLSLEALSPKY